MPAITEQQLREKLEPIVNEITDAKIQEALKSKPRDTGWTTESTRPAKTSMTQNVKVDRETLGLQFAQVARAVAATKLEGHPSEKATEYLNEWGLQDTSQQVKDHLEAQKIARQAMAKAQQAGAPTSGGFLVPETFSQEIIEFLRPMSVVRQAGPRTMPMTTGTLRLPRVDEGSTATYIGESVDTPKTELKFGQVTLTWKKLAALVPISNDLLRYSAPSADMVVRDDVARAIAQAENAAFLRGLGTDASPKGLRYWVADDNVITANQTVSNPNVNDDLRDLILKLEENNIPMVRPVWIMAPRSKQYLMTLQNTHGLYVFRDEVRRGMLWDWPIYTTTQIPVNLTVDSVTDTSEIFLVDMADAVLGESMSMRIDVSTEAAYVEGSNVRSAFTRDETAIRVITEHDFAMRRNESIAILKKVTWGK